MKSVFEKIIERLEELKTTHNPHDSYWDEAMYRATELVNSTCNKAINGAIEIVNQAAEEYGDGWIPCSERLPDSSIDVNITTRSSIVGTGSFFKEANKWVQWYCGGGIAVDVIAWQPLPVPYQPKGE